MISDTAPTLTVPLDDCSTLFVRALHGDGDAATQLYRACIPELRHWLANRVPWHDAEDLAHEALILAFKHGSRFQLDRSFRPWLRTIASRLAINLNRNEIRRRSLELSYADTHRSLAIQEDRNLLDRQSQALAQGIGRLSKPERHLLNMRFAENRTPSQIASLLGQKRVAISVRIHRTCEKLRAQCRAAIANEASQGAVFLDTQAPAVPAF